MDLADWILAYTLSQGAHTGGHFKEAAAQDIPLQLDLKKLSENYNPRLSGSKITEVLGGGFQNQDALANLTENESISQKEHVLNALMKASYLFNAPKYLGAVNGGDIDNMEKNSGNKFVKPLIALSSIADALSGAGYIPKQYGNLSFSTFNQGTPGLVWSKRW